MTRRTYQGQLSVQIGLYVTFHEWRVSEVAYCGGVGLHAHEVDVVEGRGLHDIDICFQRVDLLLGGVSRNEISPCVMKRP